MDASLVKSALIRIARLTNCLAKSLNKKNGDKSAVAMLKKYTTIGLRIPGYGAADVYNDFAEGALTYWSQSDVFDSLKPCYVMLTVETEILRSDWHAQVNLIGAAPTLQNLRIGLRRRQSGKSDVPVKQSWKMAKKKNKRKRRKKNSTLLTFRKKVPACTINPKIIGKRICCRLRSVDAHYVK